MILHWKLLEKTTQNLELRSLQPAVVVPLVLVEIASAAATWLVLSTQTSSFAHSRASVAVTPS